MNPGLEALNYMGPTNALATELNLLFKEVSLAKEKFKGSNRETVRYVRKLVGGTAFKKRFTNTILRHSGLTIKPKFQAMGPTYMFAIAFKPSIKLQNGLREFKHPRYRTSIPYDKEVQDKLQAARDSVDKDLGKIINVDSAKEIMSTKADMYFCIDTAFCLDNYHEKAKALSSEEVTAIVLHEIGHVLSAITYVNTMYRTLQEYTAPIELSAKTPEELKAVVVSLRKQTKAAKLSDTNSKYVKIMDRAMDSVDAMLADKANVNLFKSAVCAVGIAMLMIVLFPIVVNIATEAVIRMMLEDVLDLLDFKDPAKVKVSDFKHTRRDLTDLEFRADEFVVSFGYGDYLVTALSSLTYNSQLIPPTCKIPPAYAGQTLMTYNLMHVMALVMSPYQGLLEEHGETFARYQKVQNGIIKQMKIDNLPEPILNDLIDQYQRTKDAVQATKEHMRRNGSNYEKYGRVAKWLLTGNSLLKLIVNGKADDTYNILMDASDKLNNNELIFQHKKLTRKR